MGYSVKTRTALILLLWITVVYSILSPPCMSQLGLKRDGSRHSLAFNLAVSSGTAENIRLNGLAAWTPLSLSESYVEINVSQPVLLTALQVQGDPLLASRVTGWVLETSLDCESYNAENYSLSFVGLLHTETVVLKEIEFVSCIRLRPTHYIGQTPALRIELLGCVINDNSKCGHEVYPTNEILIEGGGQQLNFDMEVVVVWIKFLLKSNDTYMNANVHIYYSRSCESWNNYETSDLNIVRVTSPGPGHFWVTLEMEIPVPIKCLRVFPPLEVMLVELHASAHSPYLASNLQEVGNDSRLDANEKHAEVATTTTVQNTVEINVTLQTTDASSSQNYVLWQSTSSSPLIATSQINGMSTGYNSSVNQINPPQNSNDTDVSTIATYSTLPDTNNPVVLNESSASPMITANGTIMNNTADENTHFKSSDMNNELYNNSTTESNIISLLQYYLNTTYNRKDDFEDSYNDTAINKSTNIDSVSGGSTTTLNTSIHMINESTTSDTHSIGSPHVSTDRNRTVCGIKNSAKVPRRKRVVSGKINNPGEWPWLVSMHFLIEFEFTRKSGFKHTCGATLVAPGWVITAAHCFSDDLLDGLSNLTCWRVYFGMHDLAMTGNDHLVQERLIEAIYIYPSYNITVEPLLYDLALVKLNESVEVNDRISPVCLDDETDIHEKESQCYVSGWGQISLTSPGSRFPHTASMSTMSLSKCRDMYNNLPDENEVKQYARIEAPVLCAAIGNNGEDACQGDSGGPLMCERGGLWYQAGIVAGGYLCGHKATPGLYTRIGYYISWIRTTMELYDD